MNKLVKLILLFGVILSPQSIVNAQTFDYNGTYLTDDTTQAIAGFHFDQDANKIIVIGQESTSTSPMDQSNRMRLTKIHSYVDDYIDMDAMTDDEVAEFNLEHEIDYAAAFRNIADDVEHADMMNLPLLVDLQTPGITILFPSPIQTEIAGELSPQMVIINQPDVRFNQNLWEVSLFDISTPVLRFEANTDTSFITDDYGIEYQLMEETPIYIESLEFE